MVLTFGSERQWAGNSGYEDDPTRLYRYDNFVPNHRRVGTADLVLIRDRGGLIGVGRIGRITPESSTKVRNRCPVPGCGIVQLKHRSAALPRYRCAEGHTFDEPAVETVGCTRYTAEFSSFVAAPRAVTYEQMRAACPKFNAQNAMQPIDLATLTAPLVAAAPELAALLHGGEGSAPTVIEVERAAADDPALWGQVARRIRMGQRTFRDGLLAAYGERCAITGHGPQNVLEAAHIEPHVRRGRNASTNGLLLRADLHALFDDHLVAVEPGTMRVRVHDSLRGSPYEEIDGRPLRPRSDGRALDPEGLETRWLLFARSLGS